VKTILCYGDSNTWGQIPLEPFEKRRHPADTRWTGVLQRLAGSRYRVIEEGLNGRTTGPEDPVREGRSGLAYLAPCLDSHVPLDLLVLMLGTNDLKLKYRPDPAAISHRLRELVRIAKRISAETSPGMKILVMAPVIPLRERVYEEYHYDALVPNARALVGEYERMSAEEGVHFFDASKLLEPSPIDGAHLEAAVHERFGAAVFAEIERIYR
jgi:lysophospholipase L1-like esterase